MGELRRFAVPGSNGCYGPEFTLQPFHAHVIDVYQTFVFFTPLSLLTLLVRYAEAHTRVSPSTPPDVRALTVTIMISSVRKR